jgi:hypothetical protein
MELLTGDLRERTTLSSSGTRRSGLLEPAKAAALPDRACWWPNHVRLCTQACSAFLTACRFVGRYRRRGSTVAVSFDTRPDALLPTIMSPWAHGLPHMPMQSRHVRAPPYNRCARVDVVATPG